MKLADYLETQGTAWPGGYTIVAYCDDMEPLCFSCVRDNAEVHEGGDADGWRIDGFDIYWEGPPLYCAHCGAEIESAYGDPEVQS